MRKMPSAAATTSSPNGAATLIPHALRCRRDVERHFTAQKSGGAQATKHEIGIGDRRIDTAATIAGRPRFGSGALRANQQRAVLDARDGTAASADFENIHHRNLNRQRLLIAADKSAPGRQWLSVKNDPCLGGGTAHVEGDGILQTERIEQPPACRSRPRPDLIPACGRIPP